MKEIASEIIKVKPSTKQRLSQMALNMAKEKNVSRVTLGDVVDHLTKKK